jgi:DNA-binding response OmpR family regulator
MDALAKSCSHARVLVAEDEAIVSMLIEHELGRAGLDMIGPFATCADVSRWLASDTPDIAVLDHELRDGPCTDVAIELRRRGVPFVALTGSNPADLPDLLRNAPRIPKPDSLERLAGLVAALLRGGPSRDDGAEKLGRNCHAKDALPTTCVNGVRFPRR